MMNTQLNLLDYATTEIKRLQSLSSTKQPLPMKTSAIAERLGISGSTLNHAKRKGLLPYKCSVEGKTVSVQFAYQRNGKDYWIAIIID